MARSVRHQTTIDACIRFRHLPIRAIARFLISHHGELYDNDLEKARSSVRNVLGRDGDERRAKATTKELFRKHEITMPPTWAKERKDFKLDPPGLWLILSDLHVPFHSIKAVETAVQWGQAQKINGILLNGDLFDYHSIAFWMKEKRDFNRELELCLDMLDFLRKEFSKIPIVFKPGNHEFRLPQHIARNSPELAATPIAAVETIMGFEERNIEFLNYNQKVMAGKLPIFHGHEFRYLHRTVSPARGLFQRALTFAACSHCHNTSEYSDRDCNNNFITTWSFGCLSDLSPDWNPFGNKWNWGAGLVNFNKDGSFEVENRKIMYPSGKLK